MSTVLLSPLLVYLGKMTLISALLYGYYRLFLRNASFHPYNRWFLLGSVFLSLFLPLLRIPFPAGLAGGENYTLFLRGDPAAAGGAGKTRIGGLVSGGLFSKPLVVTIVFTLYGLVTGVFFWKLVRSLVYLKRLSGKYTSSRVEGVRLFQTAEPGAPFSFWNRLYWDKELALDSERGQAIFRHEWYHIRQKHTLDILVLTVVRSLFWFNPFFYLFFRELGVVHEFLADRYVISGEGSGLSEDRAVYAEWLVWQSIRGDRRLEIAHSFFKTHLKRRIIMITQLNNTRPRYISRVMVLPLLFLLFCAFTAHSGTGGPLPAAAAGKGAPVKGSGGKPINDLVRFYLHQLRYPAIALKNKQEETIWFSVRIGENNKLRSWTQYDAAPDPQAGNSFTITVTSRPSETPEHGEGAVVTGRDPKAVFLEAARNVAEKIPSGNSKKFAPGEYFFTIVFKIEKS